MRNIIDGIQNLIELIKYDVLRYPEPSFDNIVLPKNFTVDIDIVDGEMIATSDQLPGLITSAKDLKSLERMIEDALLTYYSIPRYISRKYFSGEFINISEEARTMYIKPVIDTTNIHLRYQ